MNGIIVPSKTSETWIKGSEQVHSMNKVLKQTKRNSYQTKEKLIVPNLSVKTNVLSKLEPSTVSSIK